MAFELRHDHLELDPETERDDPQIPVDAELQLTDEGRDLLRFIAAGEATANSAN